ncbi:MAG: transglutaminase-like domain-containing protein [Firmicutes bacterium]|nr:transglutaminase-like domain-containing protein [Bacillota bacterium]
MRKKLFFFAAALLITFLAPAAAPAAPSAAIDTSKASAGVVTVTYTGDFSKKIKVMIKNGDEKYTYDLFTKDPTRFPLQMGKGGYTVTVLRGLSGDSYSPFATASVNIDEPDDAELYLHSIQLVDFAPEMKSMKGFAALTKDGARLKDKLDLVYGYIVDNVSYDYDKAAEAAAGRLSGYLPVIDDTYKTNLGICYDYSSLFAAALRSAGIPTRLEMGYSTKVESYHAWNEALLGGKWFKMDTTYDAAAKKYKMAFSQAKADADYSVVKKY